MKLSINPIDRIRIRRSTGVLADNSLGDFLQKCRRFPTNETALEQANIRPTQTSPFV